MERNSKRIFFCLIIVAFVFLYSSQAISGWYDPNWSKRRPITVNNRNNENNLSDFQVKFRVPCFHGMQADFDDIRFTVDLASNDGVLSIPYWIEEYIPNECASVYVKVPFIPALHTATIYLYYENPDAVSESNGPAVFEFFDDFNDQDISDWNIICGEWNANNGYLEQVLTANHRKVLSPYTFTGSSITEAKVNYLSNYHYSGLHIFFSKDTYGNNGYKFGYAGLNRGGSRICRIQYGGVTDLVTNPTINVIDDSYMWIKEQVSYDGTGNYILRLVSENAKSVYLHVCDNAFTPPFTLGAYVGADIAIEDLRVRKYTSPEPGCEIGDEQNNSFRKSILNNDQIPTLAVVSLSRSPQVKLLLQLTKDSEVTGKLYDCSGKKIMTFAKRQNFLRGQHNISFELRKKNLVSNLFFLRLQINEKNGNHYCLKAKLLFIQ